VPLCASFPNDFKNRTGIWPYKNADTMPGSGHIWGIMIVVKSGNRLLVGKHRLLA
jgi:hypothetical protein